MVSWSTVLESKVAIATVVSTAGSVPGKMGARLALTESEIEGTVGGAGFGNEGDFTSERIASRSD